MSEPTEEELQSIFDETLDNQLAGGASPVVAQARAHVARLRRQIGRDDATDDDPGLTPREALGPPFLSRLAGGDDPVFESVLSAQLEAGSTRTIAEARARVASVEARRKASPRAPTPVAPREAKPSAPQRERPAVPKPSGAPEAHAPQPPQGPVGEESPEQTYERVLAEQRSAGSSDAVAVARAKVARMKSQRALGG